jgi:two-component system chemotaxis response regulator CheY
MAAANIVEIRNHRRRLSRKCGSGEPRLIIGQMQPMSYLYSWPRQTAGLPIPLNPVVRNAVLRAWWKAAPQSEPRGARMAMTVLVVDDSVTMVMSLKTTLAMSGFQVETANNGQDALKKLQSGVKPNLILTDINMPVMGGMELIRNVRALPGLRFVPILTLTTESEAAKRDEGKRAGATGWLVKPVSGNDLIAVIRKVLPGA